MTLLQMIEIEDPKTHDWRLEQLHKLGFEDEQALVLINAHVDWHQVERLRKHGCEPQLVLEILT